MSGHTSPGFPADPAERTPGVDAVRGFALMGIILVNAPYFAFELTGPPAARGLADELARWSVVSFATGKFFPIFSFLFGFGFAVLLQRSAARGGAFDATYLRRLGGLFALGVAHAVFLFFGDILVLYAILGCALWMLRRRSDRTLLALAAASLLLSVVTQVMVLTPDYAAAAPAPAGPGYLGGFWDATAQRIAELPLAATVVALFNGPSAFAMFLLGYVMTRRGLFPLRARELGRLRTPAIVAGAVGATGSAIAAAALVGWIGTGGEYKLPAALAFSLLATPLSFAMLVGMLGLAASRPGSPAIRALALVGRNTLSGYLLHSVLLGAVFCGWGLGWYGAMSSSAVLVLAVLTFAAIVALTHLWSRWLRSGPAEWLLRSFVDLRWRPLLRERPVPAATEVA